MKNAFSTFGNGLLDGITGIIAQPIKGAKQEGALGVLKGIGRGVAGVVTKPVIGAVDFVSNLAIAMEVGIIGGNEGQEEQRVYPDGVIRAVKEVVIGEDNGKAENEENVEK